MAGDKAWVQWGWQPPSSQVLSHKVLSHCALSPWQGGGALPMDPWNLGDKGLCAATFISITVSSLISLPVFVFPNSAQHEESSFPIQGSNPGLLQWRLRV